MKKIYWSGLLAAAREIPDAFWHGADTSYERYAVAREDPAMMAHDEESCQEAVRFAARARNWTSLAWWLYSSWTGALQVATLLRCGLLDHDLRDGGSTFGPDSGTECLECRRCGWSWSHSYY